MTTSHADKFDQRVWIGNIDAASDLQWLKSKKITHVVNCASHIDNFFANHGVHYIKLPLRDVPDISDDLLSTLEPSYQYITKVLERSPENNVLIHCHAGISRSASISIYYLMRKYNMTFDQALSHLSSKRSIVRPNPWYEKQLRYVETVLTK